MKDAGTFYGHLVNFPVMCYFYDSKVYFVVLLYTYFPRFGILYREKSGNPGRQPAMP
jgi:hypothetical protein